jgi:D-serine dehydratase
MFDGLASWPIAPVERLEATVLGGTPEEPKDEPMVLIIDDELSATLELGVIVIADARKGLLDRPDRRVTASLPSCVAVPSRRSCTK